MKSDDKLYNKNALNKLRKAWYEHLKELGFNDVEFSGKQDYKLFNDHSGILKNSSTLLSSKYNIFTYTYYEIARYLGHNATFLSKIDAKLLELHGDGYTINKISLYLRDNFKYPKQNTPRKRKPYSDFWVYNKLKSLKSLIFIYNDTNCLESVKESWQLL